MTDTSELDSDTGTLGGNGHEPEPDFKEDEDSNDLGQLENVGHEIKGLAKTIKTEDAEIKMKEPDTEEMSGADWRSKRGEAMPRKKRKRGMPARVKYDEAYSKGKKDGRKIDVRRRGIE
ncbi:hypothetical protein K490DRAFT_60561 [Saccharata proteae CBS 121410]|uniref:Uncharacterized protein n=1 Tax=Saccharata proteae CBS 121410 TaxID=1314787 RepID=A0A9P4HP38_9PEZI|nr:hypothetical protein K490DRAFT_60561 [Saccharata proteae CBS 121410]